MGGQRSARSGSCNSGETVVSRAAVFAAVRAEEKQTQDYKLEQASPFGAMRLGASAGWTDPIPRQMNGLHSFDAESDLSSLRKRSEEHTSELQSPCNLVCRL